MLYYLVVTLYVIVCGLLIITILLQQGKGGDIANAFGGGTSQAVFGARSGVHEMLRVQISVALQAVTMQQRLEALSALAPSASMSPDERRQSHERTVARLKQLSGVLGAVARDLDRAASEFAEAGDDEPS